MTVSVILILAIVAIDQFTKFAVRHSMEVGQSFDVIKGFFAITYYRNDGAAFSSMQGRTGLLIAVSLIAVIFTFVLLIKDRGKDKLFTATMIFICAGGLGNLIDRIVFGEVTDMISISFFPPVFNVADMAVVVGGFLAIVWAIVCERKKPGQE